jgi:WD40 repeat protein
MIMTRTVAAAVAWIGLCVWLTYSCPPVRGDESKERRQQSPAELRIQERRRFLGHSSVVLGVAVSRDQKAVVTAGLDGTIRVWDLVTGAQRWCLETEIGGKDKALILSVAVSANGRFVLSGGTDEMVRLWDIERGVQLKAFHYHRHFVRKVAIAPTEGDLAASMGDDGKIIVFNFLSGAIVGSYELSDPLDQPTCVGFHSNSRALLVGSSEGIHAWAIGNGKLLRRIVERTGGVRSIDVSPDGLILLTANGDGTIRLLDWNSGRLISSSRGHEGVVCKAVFSPDGRNVVSCSWDRRILYWDIRGGLSVIGMCPQGAAVRDIMFSPDGRSIYSVCGGWDSRKVPGIVRSLEDYAVREWSVERSGYE